jgi:outer membrane protein assembly factor BamA
MRALAAALVAVVALPSLALAQNSRAEVLEQERAAKAAQLKPYEPGKLERLVMNAEEGKLRRLIAPHNGFFAEYGYSHKPVGSGFGLGGGFRHDLFDRRARIELEAGASYRNYRMFRADFSLPRLLDEHLEVGVEAVHRYHPQEDFFGMGMDSLHDNRVSYLSKGNEVQGRAVVMPRTWLRAGTRLGHQTIALGPGRDDRFHSIEALFDDTAAPGLLEQSDYLYTDLFTEIDYRDEPGNARDGGYYELTFRHYSDRTLDRYTFNQFNLLLQQFVPVFDKKRVFAFQLGVVATNAADGNDVPFYMRPTIGGSRTLRSVDEFRFRDTHAMWFNAEYRWEAFGLLDMALFTDWGKVAPGASDLDFSDLEHAYGIGFRFNTAQAVVLRIDIATGAGEGLQYYIKFSKAF